MLLLPPQEKRISTTDVKLDQPSGPVLNGISPVYTTPSTAYTTVPTLSATNTESTVIKISSDSTLYKVLVWVILVCVVVLIVIVLVLCCRVYYPKMDKSTSLSELPTDIQTYLNQTLGTVIRLPTQTKHTQEYPHEIHNSTTIVFDEVKMHKAVSWATVGNIINSITTPKRKRSSSMTSDREFLCSAELSTCGAYEYTLSIPLHVYKVYQSGQMTPIMEGPNLYMTRLIVSSIEPSVVVLTITQDVVFFPCTYHVLIEQHDEDRIVLKSNAPELYVYDHTSVKTYQDFAHHPIHSHVVQAHQHKEDYVALTLDEIENVGPLQKRFTIKPIYEKYISAETLLTDCDTLIKNIESKKMSYQKLETNS